MHSHHHDRPRRSGPARILRGLVGLALLPAVLLAGVILLPVLAIGRLAGFGPRCGHPCRGRGAGEGDAAATA